MSRAKTIPAMFMRGGTSKGVFILERDLPQDRARWPDIFKRIMGSPCSHSRQLNGMGGGLSSLSKICIVKESPSRFQCSVDLTFAQIGIRDGSVDMHGTCGNLMAAVPLFAVEQGLVTPELDENGDLSVRVRDLNTSKSVVTRFPSRNGMIDWDDDFVISGVDGTGVRVETEYLSCGGTKTGVLWPTGNLIDSIQLPGLEVKASLVDGPNPAIFCDAASLNLSSTDLRDLSMNDQVLQKLEELRLHGTIAMGIAHSMAEAKEFRAIPKICLLSATAVGTPGIAATTLSMEVPHKAIPITISLSLAIAMATSGSLANMLATGKRIYHPTGHVDVEADLHGKSGVTATVTRSARRLMRGEIYI